ncbi:cyclase family protein [Sphingobium fuliginis]|jgi:kynurenine formamidase|uniref:Cyclase family protein n=1 Tax=Sphingobium fuliginis (strain ATCC 27551) TaxID=336203 RepID=A0A7M2GKZ1_SPHSA|nr:cyclase family protein [Sphingobium fuliginis]QOT73404.1 cyclase family protein [Sphingobium fuliginis]
MCDQCPKAPDGWIGWLDLPASRPVQPAGPWVDLTHDVGPDMPCASIFPRPSFGKLRSLPQDPFNVTDIHMVAHAGTHVDAPLHYFEDAPDMASIPPERLSGEGVVWRIEKGPDQIISVAELEQCRPVLQAGDILAVDTGWAARFGTPDYERHPSFSPEAATWLLERRIKMLACDFATPDLVYHLRQPGFDWPVHRTLLANGILICEHLTGHAAFAGDRVEFLFGALPIAGGDGSPARVLARRIARAGV